MNNESAPRLIDLKGAIDRPVIRTLYGLVEQPVERVLAVHELNRLYRQTLLGPGRHSDASYFATVLRVLNVRVALSDEDRQKIPATGPVVVVANHPFGAIEGIILGQLLTEVRPDVRLLGNHLLRSCSQVRDWIIPVDPFGGTDAVHNNVAPLKAALRWLKGGGALGTFPAGTVSHLQVHKGCVSDPPWHPSIAALVRRTGATVVPIFFEGRNSVLFQLAGLLHQSLRTALLPYEFVRRSHSTVDVRVGRPITAEKMARYEDDVTLVQYLRWKTHMLERRDSPIRPRFPGLLGRERAAGVNLPGRGHEVVIPPSEPVAEAVPQDELVAEIAALPADSLLVSQGDYQVYVAHAAQMPRLLREIGRLREQTFRAVSEGTGRALDLDRYDDTYLHLFMWNQARREIVGSYRLGQVDRLMDAGGLAALYTSSLFKFKAGFIERLSPALELGRSFIRAEYQRKPTSLALLWRGIGAYLVRNPRYKVLFGPVSISRDYHSLSRRIMVEFLSRRRGAPSLQALVRAKNPLRERLAAGERADLDPLIKDVEDISHLVAEIEEDNKGMPVLLRHYLRLGARLLSFNVDPSFGNCVDGLILVDLRTTDAKILARFMGEEGHRRFAAAA